MNAPDPVTAEAARALLEASDIIAIVSIFVGGIVAMVGVFVGVDRARKHQINREDQLKRIDAYFKVLESLRKLRALTVSHPPLNEWTPEIHGVYGEVIERAFLAAVIVREDLARARLDRIRDFMSSEADQLLGAQSLRDQWGNNYHRQYVLDRLIEYAKESVSRELHGIGDPGNVYPLAMAEEAAEEGYIGFLPKGMLKVGTNIGVNAWTEGK